MGLFRHQQHPDVIHAAAKAQRRADRAKHKRWKAAKEFKKARKAAKRANRVAAKQQASAPRA